MNNPERPAHPTNGRMHGEMTGLTKREYFAAMAMQGLAMNRSLIYDFIGDESKGVFGELISKEAIKIADELLKQLEP